MKDNFYFELLEYLYNKGLFKEVDISNIIKNTFPSEETGETNKELADYFYDTAYDNVEQLLKYIKENKYIDYKNLTPKTRVIEDRHWSKLIKVKATLTTDGWLFLHENNKFKEQKRLNCLTVWFIGATIFVGLLNFSLTLIDIKKKTQCQPLSTEIKKQPKEKRNDSIPKTNIYNR